MPLDEARVLEIIAGHNARNQELRAAIAGYSIPLDQVRQIDVEFWAPDKAAAQRFTAELQQTGVTCHCREAAVGDGRWAITLKLQASPDHITDPAVVESYARLAANYDCTYDGWGTALVELAPKQT